MNRPLLATIAILAAVSAFAAPAEQSKQFISPIYTIDKMFADPQVEHLEMARPVKHP